MLPQYNKDRGTDPLPYRAGMNQKVNPKVKSPTQPNRKEDPMSGFGDQGQTPTRQKGFSSEDLGMGPLV